MRPGISRAVPMGILGFLVGIVILVVIRSLQSMQPLMDPGVALVLGVFFSAGFFIYGMGAFDPRMNVHAHEPEPGDEEHDLAVVEHEETEAPSPPRELLGGYIWQVTTFLLLLLLGIIFFALLPSGPGIQTVHEAASSVSGNGMVAIDIGRQTYYVSQLTMLVAFVIFMLVSLVVAAGGLSLVLFGLHQGSFRVKEVEHTTLEAEPLEHAVTSGSGLMRWVVIAAVVALGFAAFDMLYGRPITLEFQTMSFFLSAGIVFVYSFIAVGAIISSVAAQTQWRWLVRAIIILVATGVILGLFDFALIWLVLAPMPLATVFIFNLVGLGLLLVPMRMPVAVVFAIMTGVLLPLFYFVLIGLVLAFAPPLLFGLSAGNALVITALILRPKFVAHWVGYGAGWVAEQLRRLPNVLQ